MIGRALVVATIASVAVGIGSLAAQERGATTTVALEGAQLALPGTWRTQRDGAAVMAVSEKNEGALVLLLHGPTRGGKSLGAVVDAALARFEADRTRDETTWPALHEGRTRSGFAYLTQGTVSHGEKGKLFLRLWAFASGEGFHVVATCAPSREAFDAVVADLGPAIDSIAFGGADAPIAPPKAKAPARARERIFDVTFEPGPGWSLEKADGLVRPRWVRSVSYRPAWRPKAYRLTITTDGKTAATRTDDRAANANDDRLEPNDSMADAKPLPAGYRGTLVSANNDYFTLPEGTHRIELDFEYDPPVTLPNIITFDWKGNPEYHGGWNCHAEHTVKVRKGERFVFCIAGTGLYNDRMSVAVPLAVDVSTVVPENLEEALRAYLLDGAPLGLARSDKATVQIAWKTAGRSRNGPFVQLLVRETTKAGWVSQRYGIAVESSRGVFYVATGLPGSAPAAVVDEVFSRTVPDEMGAVATSLAWDETAPRRREDLEKWLVKKGKFVWSTRSSASDRNPFTGQTSFVTSFASVEWEFHADGTAERREKSSGTYSGYDNSPSGQGAMTGTGLATSSQKGRGMPFQVWDVDGKTWLVVQQAGSASGFHSLEIAGKRFAIDGLAE